MTRKLLNLDAEDNEGIGVPDVVFTVYPVDLSNKFYTVDTSDSSVTVTGTLPTPAPLWDSLEGGSSVTSVTSNVFGKVAQDVFVDAGTYAVLGELDGRITVSVIDFRGEDEYKNINELLASTKVYDSGTVLVTQLDNVSVEVAATSAIDHHLVTASGLKLYIDKPVDAVDINSTITLTGRGVCQIPESYFKQADGTNLSELVTIDVSTSSERHKAVIDMSVDGNRLQNTSPVTGFNVTQVKKNSNDLKLSATDLDTGVYITGNVEYAKIDCHIESCTDGVVVNTDSSITPDELELSVFAHACDTFARLTGTNKHTGELRLFGEQSSGFGAIIDQGWWNLAGEIRGVGNDSGGGLYIDGDADVSGRLSIYGGDDVNCAWAADIQAGSIRALHLIIGSSYADGCRVIGGTEGSLLLETKSSPANTTALQLGDTSGIALAGFQVLQGSVISSGTTAIDLQNADACVIDAATIVGDIIIGTQAQDNTIYIPRKNAESLCTITNNRTQEDNKIIYKGSYSLGEMNSLNNSTLIKGMEVESCSNFDGCRAFYDGNSWVASHGYLASGTITIAAGDTNESEAHLLGYDPGNEALSIYPENSSGSSNVFWANVTSTNVVVFLSGSHSADARFRWVLRKTS